MARFQITNEAIADLDSIWWYTYEQWSEKQADQYYELIIENCEQLVDHPLLGKPYDVVVPGIRAWQIGRHLLFYKLSSNSIPIIIRILHERMDIKKHFK